MPCRAAGEASSPDLPTCTRSRGMRVIPVARANRPTDRPTEDDARLISIRDDAPGGVRLRFDIRRAASLRSLPPEAGRHHRPAVSGGRERRGTESTSAASSDPRLDLLCECLPEPQHPLNGAEVEGGPPPARNPRTVTTQRLYDVKLVAWGDPMWPTCYPRRARHDRLDTATVPDMTENRNDLDRRAEYRFLRERLETLEHMYADGTDPLLELESLGTLQTRIAMYSARIVREQLDAGGSYGVIAARVGMTKTTLHRSVAAGAVHIKGRVSSAARPA